MPPAAAGPGPPCRRDRAQMIETAESTADELADLRRAYLASLSAPLDGMWEAFAAMGRQLEIRSAGERAGYFSLDEEGRVLQFHLAEAFLGEATEVFSAVAARYDVRGAMVSTADPVFLGVCLDAHRTLRAHTYFFRDHRRVSPTLWGDGPASLELVEAGELEEVAELQRRSFDQDPGDWHRGYLENLIARRELYALRRNGEILGTGEARVSDSQPPFVDLGVITRRPHRRRGVASHVLGRLKRLCYERQQVPICSTTIENVGAQRAIARAGFVRWHRLLEVTF